MDFIIFFFVFLWPIVISFFINFICLGFYLAGRLFVNWRAKRLTGLHLIPVVHLLLLTIILVLLRSSWRLLILILNFGSDLIVRLLSCLICIMRNLCRRIRHICNQSWVLYLLLLLHHLIWICETDSTRKGRNCKQYIDVICVEHGI